MALQLKLGDRVILKESSIYVTKNNPENKPNGHNPIGVVGTITNVGFFGSYDIIWDNSKINGGFDDSDVELYVETIKPKRRRLLI